MSIEIETIQHSHVLVCLDSDPARDDLALTDRVITALDAAGHSATADAFAVLAGQCETADDLRQLIRCTVTVL